MAAFPGTIDLGKFRVVYEEERQRPSDDADGYLLQQRAIIRLNEELVKLEQREDYTVYCDDEKFKRQHGKRPSPLQYFIASIGFCMFSQFKRLAVKTGVVLRDLEMDLRMTYDLTGKFPIKDFSDAAQGINYVFKIISESPLEQVIQVAQAADQGCHTVNSMRKRMPVTGRFTLNEREYTVND
ncbi:MAG: OsmC family peroxiredoxin [Deltaproteobacteria bacterium]|nr:OsmC family peroxiredoxin [Deltaproteobacteria bacterium]